MINWREKFVAFAIHFALTLALAACAAALIFLVWYPDPFQTLVGGTGLFQLVVGCDLALGPLLSLVVYNSRKSRGKLVFDYCVIGAVQLAAMLYGVYIVADTRPVYLAFNSDRFEVVSAGDIREKELAAAAPGYERLPLGGPRLVAVHVPPEDRSDALFEALNGNDTQYRPRFYVPYESERERILQRGKPLETLVKSFPESKPLLDEAVAESGVPPERLRWLPIHYVLEFWTVLIDTETAKPVAYFDFDPYG
ncbi:MAG TPA: TfpX/TfpZ family type IV pilin accessory protein [Steroidobacteraceae bacterium]|nr:TfpX/TfpZ family type IV pilin accessory protein [Steroidobacteraceae bacterium]